MTINQRKILASEGAMINYPAGDVIKGIEKAIVDSGYDKKSPKKTVSDIIDCLHYVDSLTEGDTRIFVAVSEIAAGLIALAKQNNISFERCLVHALVTLHLGES